MLALDRDPRKCLELWPFWLPGNDSSTTIVLHPLAGLGELCDEPAARERKPILDRVEELLLPYHIPEPPGSTFTLVGLEECDPRLLGLPPMSPDKIVKMVKNLSNNTRRARFMTMEEWTQTVDPLISDTPSEWLLDSRTGPYRYEATGACGRSPNH